MNVTMQLRKVTYPTTIDQTTLVRQTIAGLDELGLPHVWPDTRAALDRAERLDRAASDAYAHRATAPRAELIHRLSLGELDPDRLSALLADQRAAADQAEVSKLIGGAAREAERHACNAAQSYADKLIDDLKPVIAAVLDQPSDAGYRRWTLAHTLADDLRAAGMLSTTRNGHGGAHFLPIEHRFRQPHRAHELDGLTGADYLNAAKEIGGGIFSNAEVIKRNPPGRRWPAA